MTNHMQKELENRFMSHLATEEQIEKYEDIREALLNLAFIIDELCPTSREKSLAWTALEQVGFYAKASIARREELN